MFRPPAGRIQRRRSQKRPLGPGRRPLSRTLDRRPRHPIDRASLPSREGGQGAKRKSRPRPIGGDERRRRLEEDDPFAEVGREAVTVEVLNVVPRSPRTFDLQWRETRYVNGQRASAERWRALITTRLQPPRTEAELMKNPLGIRIEDVSWTPDAT